MAKMSRMREVRSRILCESLHGYGTGGIGEKLQLVEIFLGLGLVLFLGHQTHEDGGLSLDF